ncbi:hypothetical protein OG840_47500 [Streptomyces sp. NBC_01764]|uniref:hypothetical protein n=1 Tax=Streptomyces sp. NBC_01764 TaxID=2975935 RepID=UPI00224F8A80|nr:hypothetical protein [Streptomyces sp. NBC_01764]MCX4409040.1 hypothetical protein [Streptomyces sp. NBC_01764]
MRFTDVGGEEAKSRVGVFSIGVGQHQHTIDVHDHLPAGVRSTGPGQPPDTVRGCAPPAVADGDPLNSDAVSLSAGALAIDGNGRQNSSNPDFSQIGYADQGASAPP